MLNTETILGNIEELDYCYECGKDLNPKKDKYSTCGTCDRSICAKHYRCACDDPADEQAG